jgi:polysaccharide chain length determinant protein (PEP-CTERM system associated)
VGAVAYCIKAPRLYQSTTLILVLPQEVPSDFIQSTVTSDATARLATLKEQVMSRPRLKEIIEKYDLYPEIRSTSTTYDAVEVMRKHIGVTVHESRNRRDTAPASFEVSYEGQSPAKVRNVTAAIANLFVDDDLKLREQQAAGTLMFLDRELERVREELRQKEELVRRFKEDNLGLLPEQMENNYQILSQLQQHLDSVNTSLQQTEDRKVLLQSQLARVEALYTTPVQPADREGQPATQQAPRSLDELRQELERLTSRYRGRHPDVVRLAASIAKLEREEKMTTSEPDSEGPPVLTSRLSDAKRFMLNQREDLLTQLKLIDTEIQTQRLERQKTTQEILAYRHRIEDGPKIEQMFVDLRRDYEEASENYESLLKKKLQAQLAENLERTQKGEQFRVLEPANLPEKPVKPNVLKVLAIGFILAFHSGFGMAFLREYLDTTFWTSKELETIIQLPVLVSVPVVNTEQERQRNFFKKVGTVTALVSMVSILVYALFFLWKMDPTFSQIPLG